jgi:acyl-CoA synthetase (AMP-forming)/AMP-acid ligase II
MTKATELAATQLCSPNFGFKHFLNMFLRKGGDGLDLSAVRLIMNGAEPISWELCEQFLEALQAFGLKRSVMFPVYGLAEATVAVSFPALGSEYSRIVVGARGRSGRQLRQGGQRRSRLPDSYYGRCRPGGSGGHHREHPGEGT